MENIWSFCKEHGVLLFLPLYMIVLWRQIRKRETEPKDKANLVGALCVFCSLALLLPASYLYINITSFVIDTIHRAVPILYNPVAFILVGGFLFLFIPIFLFSTTRFIGRLFVYRNYITQEQYEETFFRKKKATEHKAK